MGKRRRILVRVAIFLVLGAILNVAVAWGCVFIVVDNSGKLGVVTGPGALHSFEWSVLGTAGEVSLQLLNEDRHLEWVFRDRRGFPLHSMLSEQLVRKRVSERRVAESTHTCQVIGGWDIDLTGQRYLGMVMHRPLPLLPLWPAFAINTIFYALLLWVLFALPGYIKRRRRIKRGLCVKCAYPLVASSICSECGTFALHGAAAGGPATPARDYR